MKTLTKIAFIPVFALAVLGLTASLIMNDTKFARWVYNDGGRSSEPLLRGAAPAWGLDEKKFRYVGVRSTKGWIIIDKWENVTELQKEEIIITSVEGLVCYSKSNKNSDQLQHVGCYQFPD